jgi:hypothetical protein
LIDNADEFLIEVLNLHEALNVPKLAVGVDDLLLGLEAFLAPSARHRFQAHVGICGVDAKTIHTNALIHPLN